MARKRFVDLSISIEPELPSDPPMMIPKVDYINHEMGAEQMKEFYPGVRKEQLPGGLGWALEFLTLTTHSGTHLDAPYHYHPTMAKEFKENGDPKVIWEAHFAGIDIGYCHMEKMANLAAIGRPYGFTICCFPVKIKGASAGWTRPVAIIDED